MPDPRAVTATAPSPAASGRPVEPVRADGLSAGYGGQDVLRGVSFGVRAGERVAVLGPNGGGKTTLFRVLTGELAPRAGTLRRPDRCGVVPQTERSRLDFPVSALDVATMGAISTLPWWRRPGRAERAHGREALAAVGLADRADVTFGDLSGGQRQRVLVARALVQDADVLLLDEPFTGLDTTSEQRLEALMRSLAETEGRALLIATHDVEQARGWDRVLCLAGAQIAFGPPAETLTNAVLEATYGEEIVMLDCGHRAVAIQHHSHAH
jgi:manganese/zinc/iron transport system ATP- binding protein